MEKEATLRDATPADAAAIVTLNEEVVAVTSPMDAGRLEELRRLASDCVVAEEAGAVIGFVLAMRQGAAYDNGNFDWFSGRLDKFVYIDRIAISAAGRGKGIGGRLYARVAEAARRDGCLVMCAEMDLVPPNTRSLGFHASQGFEEIGTRELESGKTVSMQAKRL